VFETLAWLMAGGHYASQFAPSIAPQRRSPSTAG
jgi:hypothetical protein